MSSAVIRISSYGSNPTEEEKRKLEENQKRIVEEAEKAEKAKAQKEEKERRRYEAFRQSIKVEQRGRRGISHIFDEHPTPDLIVNERREYRTLKESCQIEMP